MARRFKDAPAVALTERQKQSFAEQGYLVVPQAVRRPLVSAARREVANRVALEPPPAGHFGPYSYFLAGAGPRPLRALLFESDALPAAQSLIDPGKFEAPERQFCESAAPSPRPRRPHAWACRCDCWHPYLYKILITFMPFYAR